MFFQYQYVALIFLCASTVSVRTQAISIERLTSDYSLQTPTRADTPSLGPLMWALTSSASRHLRQANASAAAPTPAPAAPATSAPSSTLTNLISGFLSGLGAAISPALGPLAPLATITGPLINNALTGILANGLSHLGGLLKRDDLPDSGFETFVVNVPNQGSYILMAKKPEVAVSPVVAEAPPRLPAMHNLGNLGNLFGGGAIGSSGHQQVLGHIQTLLQNHNPAMLVVPLLGQS